LIILPDMQTRRPYHHSLLTVVFALLFWLIAAPVRAGQYSQPGFYTPEVLKLANGLTVILKQRGEAPNVALRLVVGIGHDDFLKGSKQTAHMLEHLLYMGTSSHDETEIDRLVQDHGGYSNAFTGNEETIHHLDIFNQYYLWGVDFLFELFTDSSFSEEGVGMAREVIGREDGGLPSSLHRWLYQLEITKPPLEMAFARLLPNPGYQFGLETCEQISRADILAAYQRYYVPANLTLVAVGNFDRQELLARIAATFGALPAKPGPVRTVWELPYPAAAELDGTFAPLLDTEGNVQLIFRTDGLLSPDFHVLQVIERYLGQKIFEELRFKRGLTYDSGASGYSTRQWGTLAVGGSVDIERMGEVRGLIEAELDRLRSGQVAAGEIDKSRQQILLALASGYENNSAFADYYAGALGELQNFGQFRNYEDAIAAVTPARVAEVAARYLRRDRTITVLSTPTITIEGLGGLAGLAASGAVLLGGGLYLWRRKTRRAP
jgi:zinc protease